MSKTLDLRKAIVTCLATVSSSGLTYYRNADKDATFPYKTFELRQVNLGDSSRDDVVLTIDVWDKAANPDNVETIADSIEDVFNVANVPQTNILPTFFRSNRIEVSEDDRDIQHIQLEFQVQNYKRGTN